MTANPFDAFDEPAAKSSGSNPFDAFDESKRTPPIYTAPTVPLIRPGVDPSVPPPAMPAPGVGPPPPPANLDLSPNPNTHYATLPWNWVAQDDKTGAYRFAMPSSIRNPLMDIFGGTVGAETTVDPDTGTINYGMSPGANLLMGAFGAGAFGRDLAFSGNNPFMREAPSTLTNLGVTKDLPVTADELTAAVRRAGEMPERPPQPQAQPTTVWRSADHDFPVTPTGLEQTHTDGRVYAQVSQPDGSLSYVPKDELVTQGGASQAAGAQVTPASELGLTKAQEQAYQATAEGKKLLETQEPGIQDRNNYVPGVTSNAAEIEQTVHAARELKMLKQQTPDLGQEAEVIADANNTQRGYHYDNQSQGPVQLKTAKEALALQDEQQLAQVWANKGEANPQPVLDTAAQIQRSGDWMRPAVRNAVDSVTDELKNAGTDPELMHGVRMHIDDMLSPEGQVTTPLNKRVQASLLKLRESLTNVISDAAPGFTEFNEAHAAAMRPIETMQILQDAKNGFYGTGNRMEYGRFQRFMRDVVDERSSPGISPYKSIPQETMDELWNIRDDLRRSSRAVELARAQGSDSAQNLGDILRYGAKKLAGGAAGGIIGTGVGILTHSPEVGTAVGYGVKSAIENFFDKQAETGRYQRGMEMLYPRNTLGPQPPVPPP
jgi:hypothetical protein